MDHFEKEDEISLPLEPYHSTPSEDAAESNLKNREEDDHTNHIVRAFCRKLPIRNGDAINR